MREKREEEERRLSALEKSGSSGRGTATVYRDGEGRKVKNLSAFMREELEKRGELPSNQKAAEEFDWRVGKVQKEA